MRLIFALILLLAATAGAQTANLPDAPSPHRFLDRENVAIVSSFALAYTGDALSAQKFLGRGHREMNPMIRSMVTTRKGEAFATAAGFVASIGHYLHRRGHHRLERVYGWTVVTVETGLTVWNYLFDHSIKERASSRCRSALAGGHRRVFHRSVNNYLVSLITNKRCKLKWLRFLMRRLHTNKK
jgi:hypothetical protein